METPRLDALPKELIALIATSADAFSVLELSRTCRRVRSACYDSLVFKELLLNVRGGNSLDLDAISKRCAPEDVAAWARYAVADQRVCEHVESAQLDQIMRYLPELIIVKHPVMKSEHWQDCAESESEMDAKFWFSIATTILAREGECSSLDRLLRPDPHFRQAVPRDDSVKSQLFALCTLMFSIQKKLKGRRRIWPYNEHQRVAHAAMPSMLEIDMTPASPTYDIPLPFCSGFDRWYSQHTHNHMSSRYTSTGTWRGYYTQTHNPNLDPPMENIRFYAVGEYGIHAKDCKDGHDEFKLELSQQGNGASFAGRKRYKHIGQVWDWQVKPTPFGLSGQWGVLNEDVDRLEVLGDVWLWKV